MQRAISQGHQGSITATAGPRSRPHRGFINPVWPVPKLIVWVRFLTCSERGVGRLATLYALTRAMTATSNFSWGSASLLTSTMVDAGRSLPP